MDASHSAFDILAVAAAFFTTTRNLSLPRNPLDWFSRTAHGDNEIVYYGSSYVGEMPRNTHIDEIEDGNGVLVDKLMVNIIQLLLLKTVISLSAVLETESCSVILSNIVEVSICKKSKLKINQTFKF